MLECCNKIHPTARAKGSGSARSCSLAIVKESIRSDRHRDRYGIAL